MKQCRICGNELGLVETTRSGYKTDWFLTKPKRFNGIDYYRTACGKCFEQKFKTLPGPPNVVSRDAFRFFLEVPEEIINLKCKEKGQTLDTMISRYGEDVGRQKWDAYRNRQAETNTFAYKSAKYGWTEEDFKSYNRSRAQTKDNMISRYGEDVGTSKWNEYVARQSYAGCSLSYFIEKSGGDVIAGTAKYEEVNRRKARTFDNFVIKYGNDAENKWVDYFASRNSGYSKIAGEFFTELDSKLDISYNSYFQPKGQEFVVRRKGQPARFVDFFEKSSNCIIEFLGNYWHGNPAIYAPDWIHPGTGLTRIELNANDEDRFEYFRNLGFSVLTIWEKDARDDWEGTVDKCLKFIQSSRQILQSKT